MGYAYSDFSGRSNHELRLYTQLASQSIAGNTSTINWQLYLEKVSGAGSWKYTASGSSSVNIGGHTWNGGAYSYDTRSTTKQTLGSGSFTVAHDSDGTKTLYFSGYSNGNSPIGSASCSSSETLPTIPRATTPTVSPTSGYTANTVTIGHDGASSSFRHDVAYSLNGGSSYVAIANNAYGNSTSWTPAHSLLPNSTSATVKIRLLTRSSSGGSVIGNKTVNYPLYVPSSVKPSVSSVSFTDMQTSSPDIPTLMGGSGRLVQRWSRLRPYVTSSGSGGSSVTSTTVTQSGQSTSSGSTFGQPVSLSGNVPYTAVARDSRNRGSSTYTNTVGVTAYNFPSLPTPIVQRTSDAAGDDPSPTGTYLAILPLASVSSLIFGGSQKNLIEYQIRIKPVGGSFTTVQAWASSPGTTWVSKYVTSDGYLANTAYAVEVSIRDLFGKNGHDTSKTVKTLEITVPTESVFMDWDQGEGVGLGKYRTPGRMFDVFGQIYQNNGKAVLDTESDIAASRMFRQVIPSSVSASTGTATVADDGTITFNGVGSLYLNGIFGGDFDNYKVLLWVSRGPGSAGNLYTRMSVGGAKNMSTVSSYSAGKAENGNVINFDDRNSALHCTLGYLVAEDTESFVEMTINRPWKSGAHSSAIYNSTYGKTRVFGAWEMDIDTQFDGLYLYSQSETMLGKVKVFGYV